MKKILLFIAILMVTVVFCDVKVYAFDIVPQFVSMVQTNTVGLVKVSNILNLYLEPDTNSQPSDVIVWEKSGITPNTINAQDLFVIFLPDENKAYMAVQEENNGWYKVIYNNTTGDTAWIKSDSDCDFYLWENFLETFGKKYGLKILEGTNYDEREIYSEPDDYSNVIGHANKLEKINLHSVKGNWVCVSVTDKNDKTVTGYIQWRDENGIKYLFPDIP